MWTNGNSNFCQCLVHQQLREECKKLEEKVSQMTSDHGEEVERLTKECNSKCNKNAPAVMADKPGDFLFIRRFSFCYQTLLPTTTWTPLVISLDYCCYYPAWRWEISLCSTSSKTSLLILFSLLLCPCLKRFTQAGRDYLKDHGLPDRSNNLCQFLVVQQLREERKKLEEKVSQMTRDHGEEVERFTKECNSKCNKNAPAVMADKPGDFLFIRRFSFCYQTLLPTTTWTPLVISLDYCCYYPAWRWEISLCSTSSKTSLLILFSLLLCPCLKRFTQAGRDYLKDHGLPDRSNNLCQFLVVQQLREERKKLEEKVSQMTRDHGEEIERLTKECNKCNKNVPTVMADKPLCDGPLVNPELWVRLRRFCVVFIASATLRHLNWPYLRQFSTQSKCLVFWDRLWNDCKVSVSQKLNLVFGPSNLAKC